MNFRTDGKQCSRCGSRQPLEGFDRDRRSADGRRSICKQCRRDSRLNNLQPARVGGTPNNIAGEFGDPTANAKNPPNPAVSANKELRVDNFQNGSRTWRTIERKLSLFWLGVLLVGGFTLSGLNGAFALYDTAKSFLPQAGYEIAVLASGVLTLATAVSASWSVRFIQLHRNFAATLMILIFLLIQSLNIIVNHTGVKVRLTLTRTENFQRSGQLAIEALLALKADYQKVIDRYPPSDKSGKPVVWKPQITETVEMAYQEIRQLNSEIKAKQLGSINPTFKLDWRIVLAWLLLPELSMLTAILVFSMGFSASEPAKFKN